MGGKRGHLITATSSSNPYPAYSPTGHIIYTDGNFDTAAIWALPFSLTTLQATDKAFPIAPHGSSPRVSHTGTLVYSDVPSNHVQLAWKDRSGNEISNIGEPIRQDGPALSPDGHRLTVVNRENDVDTWLYDVDRGTKTRFTFDSTLRSPAVWTPSGDEITYAVLRNGKFDIASKPSNGNSEAKLLVSTPLSERAPDWSPDGRFLIYMAGEQRGNTRLLYLERHKDGSLSQPMVFVKTTFNEANPRFSPDGRYVAYVSDESGRNEVFVRDFPNGVNKWLISANGGTAPRWSRDAKEVFYVQEDRLMAVSVATHPKFSPGVPVSLFESRLLQLGYDVSPDGKRFVVLVRPKNEPPISIHIVDNWFTELQQRVPTR
jgi:Tol biopolymer transport system component